MVDAKAEMPASAPPPDPVGDSHADGYFEVKATSDKATLLVKSALKLAKIPLTVELIQTQIAKAGVVACVDEALVRNIAQEGLYDKTHIVASARAAVDGKDARIEEIVTVDADITPKVLENGKADYKNVDNIRTVQAGTVLAVKHPATTGETGRDVFGKESPSKPGKDVPFKVGVNVTVSPDGLNLVAAKGGFLFHQAGAICIGEGYVVKGDVGFKTGNIHYHGTVQVQGGVGEGFTVEADGDVHIDGAVDGSDITSHEGGVYIKQAIFGHGRALLKAKREIKVHSVQDAKIHCLGGLEVQKLLRNCEVETHSVKADGSGCLMQGGKIRSFGSVFLAAVGGEGVHTEVQVVDLETEKHRAELSETEAKLHELGLQAGPLENKIKGMKSLIERLQGRVSPMMAGDLKTLSQKFLEIRTASQQIETHREELRAFLRSPQNHTGFVSIKEKIHGSVKVVLYGHSRELGPEEGGRKWIWSEEGVAEAPLG